MAGRTIAIGDIHGCLNALSALIRLIDPQPQDTIVTLGDYVDRGLDSKGVLELLIQLEHQCRLVPILGNHDEMMLRARNSPAEFEVWKNMGGQSALESYGDTNQLDQIPPAHFEFLEKCLSRYETDTHFFLHANYKPNLPLDQLDVRMLRWRSLRDEVPGPHVSGKIAVLGHTPQPDILDLGYLICVDTGCCKGGWLTAFDVNSRRIWQVNERGDVRS